MKYANPTEIWNQEIQKKLAAGMDMRSAVSNLATEKPDLHTAYLAQYNRAHGRIDAAKRLEAQV